MTRCGTCGDQLGIVGLLSVEAGFLVTLGQMPPFSFERMGLEVARLRILRVTFARPNLTTFGPAGGCSTALKSASLPCASFSFSTVIFRARP